MSEKFSIQNFNKISKEVLDFQLNNLYPIRNNDNQERLNLLFLNHDRNFSSFLTIMHCVKHEKVADIYTISRSMFESVINMALLSKSLIKDDLDRYQNHQFVDVYKTYFHLKKLGFESVSGLNYEEVKSVEQKRNDYLKKFDGKRDNWSGSSMEERVQLVDNNYTPTCNENKFYEYLYCQVYRKGSRLTHSSFGGLSSSVMIENIKFPDDNIGSRFKVNEPHLIFSCFHSLIVFLSSIRFIAHFLNKDMIEDYYNKITRYIISEN